MWKKQTEGWSERANATDDDPELQSKRRAPRKTPAEPPHLYVCCDNRPTKNHDEYRRVNSFKKKDHRDFHICR